MNKILIVPLFCIRFLNFIFFFSFTAEICPLTLKEVCRSAIRVQLRASAENENPPMEEKEKKVASARRKNSGQRIRKIVVPPPDGRRDSFGSQWFSETNAEDWIDVNAQRAVDRPNFSSVRRCLEASLSENQRRQQSLREERMCSEHNVSLNDCGCKMDKEVDKSGDAGEKSQPAKFDCCRKASLLGDTSEITCTMHGNNADYRDSIDDHKSEDTGANCINISKIEVKRIITRSRMNGKLMAKAKNSPSHATPLTFLKKKMPPIPTGANASTSNFTTIAGNIMVGAEPCSAKDFEIEEEKRNKEHEAYLREIDKIDKIISEREKSNLEKTKQTDGLGDHELATGCKTTYLKRSAEENDGEGSYSRRIRTDNEEFCRPLNPEEFRHAFGFDELEDYESDSEPESYHRDYLSCYTYRMTEKIGTLPLPPSLKMYLNFSRPM